MADQIVEDLLDLMPDTIRVRRATGPANDEGEEPYEAEPGTEYKCKISGITEIVNNTTRHQLKATIGTRDVLKNEDMYILPERYDPRVYFGGVQVQPVSDENGHSHSVVFF